jgi:hypothetical protein
VKFLFTQKFNNRHFKDCLFPLKIMSAYDVLGPRCRGVSICLEKPELHDQNGQQRRWGEVNNKHEFDAIASLVN